jgi:hypothetical protein
MTRKPHYRAECIIFVIACLLALGGCGVVDLISGNGELPTLDEVQEDKFASDEEIKASVDEYLRGKYGDDISYDVDRIVAGGTIAHSDDQLYGHVSGENAIGAKFYVSRVDSSFGKFEFSDTYYGTMVYKELEKLVGDMASKYFKEYKVFFWSGTKISNNMVANIPLREALDCDGLGSYNLRIVVDADIIGEADFEKQAKALLRNYDESIDSLDNVLFVVYRVDSKEYDNINENNPTAFYSYISVSGDEVLEND